MSASIGRIVGPGRPFAGRRIVLGVSGGIAAYKTIQVARDLTRGGAEVDVVLTRGALQFLTPLPFESVTGRRAYHAPYLPGEPLAHIGLAREADLVVVAPATANFLARARAGMADDLLTAVLLAGSAPVLLCPAMNDRMFDHPATRANLDALADFGYGVVGPAIGPLAWGEGEGPGRLVEPEIVTQHAARALDTADLAGRRVLITAGPTREPVDPVRYLGNRSSGRMGFALAEVAWRRGAEVTLITGPTQIAPPVVDDLERVETAEEMEQAVRGALPDSDVFVMAAAVADFAPAEARGRKIKKETDDLPSIPLRRTPDILRETRAARPDGCVVVGFALETSDPVPAAERKLRDKGLDLVIANDASSPDSGFEVETNQVTIVQAGHPPEALPVLPKLEVADAILDRVAARLAEGR